MDGVGLGGTLIKLEFRSVSGMNPSLVMLLRWCRAGNAIRLRTLRGRMELGERGGAGTGMGTGVQLFSREGSGAREMEGMGIGVVTEYVGKR